MDTSKYINFNQLVAEIRQALHNALAILGYYPEWQVVRANQSTIQALQNNTVYFDIISRRRYGVQGSKPIKKGNDWVMQSMWYEELLIQVSAFKQRNPDTDNRFTNTSSDVIALLQGLINGSGDIGLIYSAEDFEKPRLFQNPNFQIIRSTDIREIEFETDSGLKDKFPQFDFLLVVEQRLLKNMEKIDTIELETKRI